ncbi:hypothetical protein BO94DRAFT_537314 [Aspergillus sclerotioniger CBS 115572]|uniref:Uncharacterized protein n=1 Tax=Aspergillus sclerotioniger CBS 115572 TaxID=1450535 RepID=A0A317W1B7_9EURO|nr:hypothetical protein BO94DRAFT_537314 [Aspergillus sclerotioniger CBS 115572]PWY80436.1 hypothetical protein BO94DRAFT_537314 [Aspergillus sclerotioniger CBS 115572]
MPSPGPRLLRSLVPHISHLFGWLLSSVPSVEPEVNQSPANAANTSYLNIRHQSTKAIHISKHLQPVSSAHIRRLKKIQSPSQKARMRLRDVSPPCTHGSGRPDGTM